MNKLATILLCVNFITVLFPQPGYIHPDEFFQSTEVIAGDVLDVVHFRAWEFDPSFPVRSVVFPYVLMSPPLYLLRWLNSTVWQQGLQISTVKVVMSTRLPLAFLSVFGYLATGRLADSFQVDRYLSTVLYCSSYVTWTYYTRTFSNSIESVALAIVLLIAVPLAGHSPREKNKKSSTAVKTGEEDDKPTKTRDEKSQGSESDPQEKPKGDADVRRNESPAVEKSQGGEESKINVAPFLLGAVTAAGIFNRPTFIVFAFVPVILWLLRETCLPQPGWFGRFVKTSFKLGCGAWTASAAFIAADTVYYRPQVLREVETLIHLVSSGEMSPDHIAEHLAAFTSSLVVTPLNFISYNTDPSNLAEHGLHPRALHFFINLPLLLGPAYIPFLVVSALSVYQLVFRQQSTEQSARRPTLPWLMLMAVVPVAALSAFPHQESRFLIPLLPVFMVMAAKVVSSMAPARLSFLALWVVFNVLLTLVYGYMHQAALVPAMSIYQQKLGAIASKPHPASHHAIFYKTYPPPRHLLLLPASSSDHVHIHDLAGGPVSSVQAAVQQSKSECRKAKGGCQIFLFAPATVTPWVEDQLSSGYKLQSTSICPHLSMEAAPKFKAWWRNRISFEEFVMEFCLNIIKIS